MLLTLATSPQVWGHRQPVILHYRRTRVGGGTFWVQGMLSTSDADGGFGMVMERVAPAPPPRAGVAGGAADFVSDPLPSVPGGTPVSASAHNSVQSPRTPATGGDSVLTSDRSTGRGGGSGREDTDGGGRGRRRRSSRSPGRSPRRSSRHRESKRRSGQPRSSRSTDHRPNAGASGVRMASERSAASTSRSTGRAARTKGSLSLMDRHAAVRGARASRREGGLTKPEASLLHAVHSQFGISAEADSAHLASATLRFLAQHAVDALMLLIMDARGRVRAAGPDHTRGATHADLVGVGCIASPCTR